ncbi:MAG TPA: TolC family protein [Deltaproteobacteria bacterium]|nr:TolC family protein [Deltaproteobacteria bacterium]
MLFLFCHCSMPGPARAEEYSLRDLYRIALERAETIRIADENIAYSVQDRRRAISALLPRLSAFASYQKFDEERYNTWQFLDFSDEVLVQPDRAHSWGLRADQNLSLSLREITAVRIGSNDIRRSRYDLASIQETYLLEVAQAYYNVLMAKKVLDIAESNLERVTKYREAARARLNVGEITETVLLRADSELSSAKSNMVKARNSLSLADATLARLVGITPPFTLAEAPRREAPAPSLEELKSTAFAQRPDLKSLEAQKEMARLQVSFARGAYWPNLNLSGVFQRADQEPASSSLNTETTYGSVSVVFPFFEGGLRRAEVQQAKVRERQASLQYESEKKTVGLEVERAYLDLMTRRGTIDFLADQLKFAQDNYRGVSRQFALGLASSIDVIDANNLLVSSQRQLAEAEYSYQLAILEVERATGTFMKEVRGKTE